MGGGKYSPAYALASMVGMVGGWVGGCGRLYTGKGKGIQRENRVSIPQMGKKIASTFLSVFVYKMSMFQQRNIIELS